MVRQLREITGNTTTFFRAPHGILVTLVEIKYLGKNAANKKHRGYYSETCPLAINKKPLEIPSSGLSISCNFPVHTRRSEALDSEVPPLPPLIAATP